MRFSIVMEPSFAVDPKHFIKNIHKSLYKMKTDRQKPLHLRKRELMRFVCYPGINLHFHAKTISFRTVASAAVGDITALDAVRFSFMRNRRGQWDWLAGWCISVDSSYFSYRLLSLM